MLMKMPLTPDAIDDHVLDRQERELDYRGDVVFEDLEGGEKLPTHPLYIRSDYRKMMGDFLMEYKRQCHENHIDYNLIDTGTPYDVALLEYMIKRARINS